MSEMNSGISKDGNTALHYASSQDHLTTAEALIATANVNDTNGVIWFEINKYRQSLCCFDLFYPIAARLHAAPLRRKHFARGAMQVAARSQGWSGGER